jgi:hypothetical protein
MKIDILKALNEAKNLTLYNKTESCALYFQNFFNIEIKDKDEIEKIKKKNFLVKFTQSDEDNEYEN